MCLGPEHVTPAKNCWLKHFHGKYKIATDKLRWSCRRWQRYLALTFCWMEGGFPLPAHVGWWAWIHLDYLYFSSCRIACTPCYKTPLWAKLHLWCTTCMRHDSEWQYSWNHIVLHPVSLRVGYIWACVTHPLQHSALASVRVSCWLAGISVCQLAASRCLRHLVGSVDRRSMALCRLEGSSERDRSDLYHRQRKSEQITDSRCFDYSRRLLYSSDISSIISHKEVSGRSDLFLHCSPHMLAQ